MSDVSELLRQGHQARREHRSQDALNIFAHAVILSLDGDSAQLAEALISLAQIERDEANFTAALMHYNEAASIFREGDQPLRFAHAIRHVGDIHTEARDFELAEPCFQQALAIYRAHPDTDRLELANAIRGYALLKQSMDKKPEAQALWEEARELYRAVGIEAGVNECSRRIAMLAHSQGETL